MALKLFSNPFPLDSFTNAARSQLTKVRGSKSGILYYIKIYIAGKKSPIPLVFVSITVAQNIAQNLGRFLRINVQDLTDRWS